MKRQITERVNSWQAVILICLLILLIFVPFWGGHFIVYLITYALIYGIFALAYDLVFGYTGMISLGHGIFFGCAAYLTAILVKVSGVTDPFIIFGGAIALGAVLGLFIGYFSTFVRGIYVVLITFVFAELFFLLNLANPGGLTWGESGITGFRPSPLFGGTGLYYLTLGIFIVSFLIIRAIVNSQLGDILKGIRENEDRLLSLGYNTRQYKIFAFVISGVFSAVAGVLMAFVMNAVGPSLLAWHTGADILVITVLGGPGTLIGPVVAAFVVIFAKFYACSWIGAGNWVYLLGAIYIGVVMFLPGGIFNTPKIASLVKTRKALFIKRGL